MGEVWKVGDLVWAKMKGFAPWPAKIAEHDPEQQKRPAAKKGGNQWIFFFGSNNYAWIEESNLKPYFQFKDTLSKTSKAAPFREAVEAIEEYVENQRKGGGNIGESASDAEFNRLRESFLDDDKGRTPAKGEGPAVTPKQKIKKDIKKSRLSESASNGSSAKRPRKGSQGPEEDADLDSTGSVNHAYRKPAATTSLLDRPSNVVRPDTPPLDIEGVTQTLKEKNIMPSMLKFGFLGLGIMGSGIVKNLLNSGHSVIVWNRTPDKCKDFVKAGAEECLTPSDVVAAADIIFSCVADPKAAKEMVFGNCGVLLEITPNKGYVEMTGVDADTSHDIAEAVQAKGGRFLEAQIQGSKNQAEEGSLVILAAGDRSLFDECQTCFQAMGRNSFYFGDVGNASKMNLVLQLMAGVTMAGLAEGMALADRAGLQQKDVLEVLELTSLACPMMIEKSKAIIDGGFQTNLPLQHLQKDMKLSLMMGDSLEQPLPLTATANEVFKHAKRLGYGDHDASAVYIRARF
ncbi:cytokine-like nuclear factor N-PAC [Neocloeon triangulifer]|uniref:cytokine-like nuclear factor N-PAC n=1 Tax=Neocloeon triangulifer TaxID=2078957 RepID=UPI00286EF930|nr:cytokine-like nuclear factor N-PAC [Neocloeon triangulifer]